MNNGMTHFSMLERNAGDVQVNGRRAAELRAELERNKVVNLETCVDKEIAEKFYYKIMVA